MLTVLGIEVGHGGTPFFCCVVIISRRKLRVSESRDGLFLSTGFAFEAGAFY